MAKGVTVFGIIVAFLAKWIADEAKAWLPWCARKFFDLSVRLLPVSERERFSEEWCSHVESFPGSSLASVHFVWAALGIRFFVVKESILESWMLFRARATFLGILAYYSVNARLSRFFGSNKPVVHEPGTEGSNLVAGFVVVLIAIALFTNLFKTEPTAAA